MLTKATIDAFLKLLSSESRKLADDKLASRLHYLEARYTFSQLKQILSHRRHLIDEATLIDCFKERWERIQHSDIQYLHDLTNPANLACSGIARELGDILHVPYLTLLMPSLLAIKVSEYTTSSYADDLHLYEIILSDDNRGIIHIPDVIDNAQEDGILKHNYLSDGRVAKLSQREQDRALSRHKAVAKAHEALMHRVDFKLCGDTVGAALNRLIQGLYKGGVRGNGFELESGGDANTAIVAFSNYMETLADEIRTTLLEAGKFDRFRFEHDDPEWISVGDLWETLTQPQFEDDNEDIEGEQSVNYCVELIADPLAEILEDNSFLYDLVSYEGDAAADLSQLSVAVTQTRISMQDALPTLQKQSYYGAVGDDAVCFKLLIQLEKDKSFSLHKDDIVYVAEKYASFAKQGVHHPMVSVLARLLIYITKDYDSRFVSDALAGMSVLDRRQFFKLTGVGMDSFSVKPPESRGFFPSRAREKRKFDDDHFEGGLIKKPN